MTLSFFNKAAKIAIYPDERNFLIGCIGIRKDGVIVSSRNGSVFSTVINPREYKYIADAHAECRNLKKCGHGGVLYVARMSKTNEFAMARPCHLCQFRCKVFKTQKVYYTINKNQYGVWYPQKDYDIIFDF